MKRVFLFVLTNLAVLLVAGIVMQLLGVPQMLAARGHGIPLQGLLAMSAVFGMTGSVISLLSSKWIAKRSVGARVIEQPQSPAEEWLLQTVTRLAQAAGIGMPEVAIYQDPTPNAFATGARRDAALVAVSTGLLRGMQKDEVEAVLGHEVSHIANGDMVTLTLIQGVLNTFVIFLSYVAGILVDSFLRRGSDDRGPGMGSFAVRIVAQLVFGMLASLIVMAFSRRREFRADAGGARLAGPPKMIAALERLRAGATAPLPGGLAAFGISGGRPGGFTRFFLSHPPLEERIARLRAGAGLAA
jgi:heat shock protein HtpX